MVTTKMAKRVSIDIRNIDGVFFLSSVDAARERDGDVYDICFRTDYGGNCNHS